MRLWSEYLMSTIELALSQLLQAALLAAGAVQGTALPAAVCQAATAGAVATAAICGWGYVTVRIRPPAHTSTTFKKTPAGASTDWLARPVERARQTAGVPAAQTPAAVLSGTAEVPRALLKGLTAGGYATYYSGLILSNLPLVRSLFKTPVRVRLVWLSGVKGREKRRQRSERC